MLTTQHENPIIFRISNVSVCDCVIVFIYTHRHKHTNADVKVKKRNQIKVEGRKEMFYLMTHSTHFIYAYMASNI